MFGRVSPLLFPFFKGCAVLTLFFTLGIRGYRDKRRDSGGRALGAFSSWSHVFCMNSLLCVFGCLDHSMHMSLSSDYLPYRFAYVLCWKACFLESLLSSWSKVMQKKVRYA